MSHVSLYRKYRPQTFDQVLGQDAVVESLQGALKSGKISHAYLFAGSRGTGKTSVARIFAKELGTSPNDIYEIDAASNNGVDEIRELRDGVNTLPFDSKYKIYILDEVHMLSKAAFNALLKTLEEPPAHVIFILATTELHKVLDTVKSRCQVFEFKKPTIEVLTKLILDVSKKEGIDIEVDAANLIAKISDGAFRDTLNLLDRIRTQAKGKNVTRELLLSLTNLPTTTLVNAFIKELVAKNLPELLEMLQKEFVGQGMDRYEQFLNYLIERVRIIILFRFNKKLAEEMSATMDPDSRAELETWAKEKNIIDSRLLIDLLGVTEETRKSHIPTIPLELTLIQLLGSQ